MSDDVDNTRDYTPRGRYEVGCACCGVEGHYQHKSDALDAAQGLVSHEHQKVTVFDRMAHRGVIRRLFPLSE